MLELNMKIKWTLDTDEGIDPIELLGNITIYDKNKNSIGDEVMYIDSFYYSISEGLLNTKSESQLVIEQFDNPNNITFIRRNDNLEIKYKKSKILVKYSEAINELCSTYRELTKVLGGTEKTANYIDLNRNILSLCNKSSNE